MGRDGLCCCLLLDRPVPAKTRRSSWCCPMFIVSCQKGALNARRLHCAMFSQGTSRRYQKVTQADDSGQGVGPDKLCVYVSLGVGGKEGREARKRGEAMSQTRGDTRERRTVPVGRDSEGYYSYLCGVGQCNSQAASTRRHSPCFDLCCLVDKGGLGQVSAAAGMK